MNHIRKAEQKCSETRLYRYIIGFAILLLDCLKRGLKAILKHITETLMCISFIGMVIAFQAFDNNVINYTTAILFITVLGVLIATLIKVKILECRDKDDE